MDSVRRKIPCRLVDYLVVVGVRKPTVDSTETPELLRRFPQKDHEDFVLPGDVVFFCQPEGCNTVSKKFSLREANSFAFTLTEKDSGNVRYGICVNVFRPCLNFIQKDRSDFKDTKLMVRKRSRFKRDFCMSLTSLCIISHHPFFPTFRECLFFLRKMIDSRTGLITKLDKNDNIIPGINSWSVFTCTEDQKTSHLANDMEEVETWIQRLLLAQAPVAGRTRVELHLHSPETYPPLTFALPESNRFPLVDFPIHIPLELLGVETCLKVLTCILLEHKVVIQSRDYNALTMSVIALTSLLYPLEYMFPIIPLLPTCMNSAEQLLLAPTPFVIGVPASFFRYKSEGFQMPGDVWIVDLDSNKITVPLTADELPPLPQPEGALLMRNLKMALQSLSMPPQTVSNLDETTPLDDLEPPDEVSSWMGQQLVFGNDVDAVDIAVRVALVKFFTAPNILGGIKEHTRTLRLFSRPVVALQRLPFLKSRPKMSEFVLLLSESQSLEYYGEWLVYPTNTVFTKILKGIHDPQIIGDKAKWFTNSLEPVVYQVFDSDSKIFKEPWIDVDYEPSLIFDEDEVTPNNDEDDDSSSCHSSVGDLVQKMISGGINGSTPAGPHLLPFAPVRASSPMPDVQASFSLPGVPVVKGNSLDVQSIRSIRGSLTYKAHEPSDSGMPDSATCSLSSGDSCSIQDDDSEDFSYSVSNPPTPRPLRKITSDTDSENTFVTATSSRSGSSAHTTLPDKQNSMFVNSTEAVLGLWNSFKKSTISVTKPAQQEISEKPVLNGFAKKIPTNPVPNKLSLQEEKSPFFPFPGIRQKAPLPGERAQGRPSLVKQTSAEKQIQSENQQFLKEVIHGVMKGDGVGWLASKRLRRLMCDEPLRVMVASRLYSVPSADKSSDAVDDMPKLWWNTLSSLSLGWSAPSSSSSTWSTGTDSTQSPLPEAKRVSRNVFRGMLEVLKAAVYGLEVSVENEGIGGIASAFQFLEIAHTHYHGRDIREQSSKLRDDDEMSVISNADSTISNLSDHSRDMSVVHSWVAETGKRHVLLNGKGDTDSGHDGMSDANGEIETVMSGVSHATGDPRERVSRSNSDFAAPLSQREYAGLKDKVTRSRSVDPTRIREMARASREKELRQERCRSPAIAHMKLNNNVSRKNSLDRISQTSSSVPPSPFLRKSNLNKGFRYYNGDIFPVEDEDGRRTTGRRYLFEGLLAERSSLWDNMDFWESIYLDAVAAERNAVGMDQGPAEMIDRYNSLGPAERKRLEEDEDRLLATMLYNLVAFMLALNVEKDAVKKKVRRLLGKSHIGLLQSQQVNDLLDNLQSLNGNDIDLKPAGSRQMLKHSFVVHSGDSMNGDVFFMEVCDDCILLRTGVGAIVERWWYEKVVNITYCPKTKVLCLWCRQKEETILNKFCTKKCKALYFCIKESLQRAADRLSDKGTGVQLGGEFPVKDLSTDEDGCLQVTLEGIGLKFATRRVHIDLCHIRNCSTQGGVFLLEEFVPSTQETIQHRFGSQKCNQICYAVLCLFSYVAASKNSSSTG
ncbi:MAP kinase-activating death domain protein-like isoform X2 [Montipora capricornis]|uniref:MAP kinase-activating death domain protein-like isoform X2 n=1 Tax=Montipora capricornis TaxID=246305 RepID=UPI0035F11E5B